MSEPLHDISNDVAGFYLVQKVSFGSFSATLNVAPLNKAAQVTLLTELEEKVQVVHRL